MEAMDYEGVRCAPLLTKAFSAHIDLRAREAASRGTEEGDETVAELTLLAAWVTEQRERQRNATTPSGDEGCRVNSLRKG
jgi:hypothetical protein